jgi:two-component system, cell cycle response regulator DivK
VGHDPERRRGRSDDVLRQQRRDDQRQWTAPHSRGVLLVNCVPDEQELYTALLERAGIDPIVTCAVESAIDVARVSRPAVVITDVTLTNATALDLIAALRGDDRTRHAFIIVLSARAFPADRAAAERTGCDVFLAKPCLPVTLLAEVVRALGTRQTAD